MYWIIKDNNNKKFNTNLDYSNDMYFFINKYELVN